MTEKAKTLGSIVNQTAGEGTKLSETISNGLRDFRQIQLPLAKIGLGSMEGDLIFMLRKYLEIVGLVMIVWLLGEFLHRVFSSSSKVRFSGYFHFSVSWILLAVFIYLFRQRQRTQFKERHQMLKEINANEEQYIKARLDELPSWVRRRTKRKETKFSSDNFLLLRPGFLSRCRTSRMDQSDHQTSVALRE